MQKSSPGNKAPRKSTKMSLNPKSVLLLIVDSLSSGIIILFICVSLFQFVLIFIIAPNGQGLLQGWNSLLVRPEPLLIKDIKVQVNKQKPNNVRPAQMKHNSDKMTIAPMSSQPCSKPNVVCSILHMA